MLCVVTITMMPRRVVCGLCADRVAARAAAAPSTAAAATASECQLVQPQGSSHCSHIGCQHLNLAAHSRSFRSRCNAACGGSLLSHCRSRAAGRASAAPAAAADVGSLITQASGPLRFCPTSRAQSCLMLQPRLPARKACADSTRRFSGLISNSARLSLRMLCRALSRCSTLRRALSLPLQRCDVAADTCVVSPVLSRQAPCSLLCRSMRRSVCSSLRSGNAVFPHTAQASLQRPNFAPQRCSALASRHGLCKAAFAGQGSLYISKARENISPQGSDQRLYDCSCSRMGGSFQLGR